MDDLQTMTAERDAAVKRANDAEKARAVLEADFKEVSAQRDKLTTELAAAKKQSTISKAPKPPKLRPAGPMAKDAERPTIEALNGSAHTIVFSDGKNEIAALDPVIASGPVWQSAPAGAVLIEELKIKPERRVTLAGFAVFDEAGKQVGWSPLMTPLKIGPGQEIGLRRQVIL